MNKIIFTTIALAVLMLSSCSPAGSDIVMSLSEKYVSEGVGVPADGGKVSFTYTISGMKGGETVTAESDASWIGGFDTSNTGVVSFIAEYNGEDTAREAGVTVSCGKSSFSVRVLQATHAKPEIEVLDRFGLETNAAGGNGFVVFSIKNVDPRGKMEITTDVDWISEMKHNPVIKENTTDTLAFYAASNTGDSKRSGKVTIEYSTPDNVVREVFNIVQGPKEYDMEFGAKLVGGWYYGRSNIKDESGAVAPGPEKSYIFYLRDIAPQGGYLAFMSTNFGVSLLSLTVPSEEDMEMSTIPIPPAEYKYDTFSEGISGKHDCFCDGYTGYYYYSSTVMDDFAAVHRANYEGGVFKVTKHSENLYECELTIQFHQSWTDGDGKFHEDGYIHMNGEKNARAVYRGPVHLVDGSDGM